MSVHESEVVQGRIFFLPSEEDLPEGAVRRGHGKPDKKGAYNHPLIIVSRPEKQKNVAHFMSLTSFQGQFLGDIYKPSDSSKTWEEKTRYETYGDKRRTWYLPIAPSKHPDAVSKKTKKRFPILCLQDGVELKKDSYINIRNICKVDINHLQSYSAWAKIEGDVTYQLTRDSLIQMLAKTKSYFDYEPGPQFSREGSMEPVSDEEISNAMADFPEETGLKAMEETSMASSSNRADQTTYASMLGKGEGAVHEDTAGSALESEVLPPPSDAASQGKGKGKGKGRKTWTAFPL